MKKRTAHRRHHHAVAARHARSKDHYLVLVRGWVFLVAFALMMGMGAVVGGYINQQLNSTTPQVAGVQTVAR